MVLGYATAAAFLEQGARVLITGRNPGAVQRAVQALGEQAAGFTADQAKLEDLAKLKTYAHDHYGKVDTLFINAGVAKFSSFEDAGEATFDEIMDINFKGSFFTVQQLLPLLKDGGNIIFLSAINAAAGMPGAAVLSASKAALNSLSRTLSRELAPRRIRVNVVSPGPVDTPLFEKTGVSHEQVGALRESLQQVVPLGRMATAAEVARLVVFLASDEASFITGGIYNIDGGMSINALAVN